jgi:polar amino acid transport system substrate-binding protein
VTGTAYNAALHDALPADILEKGVITLATDPTDPPLEFYDENNVIVGSEVDMAAALAEILGVKIELVPSKFDAIIPGVEAGRFDGSVSGFADRKNRQEVVDFVDYFTTSRALLVKTGAQPDLETATELCGKSVAVAKGTTMADSIVELSAACEADGKEAIDGQVYPDQAACTLAVQSGRADVTIQGAHAALWIAKNSGGELEVYLRPNEGNDINGILLKKGGLVEPFQKAIQQLMDSGDFERIWAEWGLQDVILSEATINGGVNES